MEFIKKTNKKENIYRTIMTIVITAFITFLVTTVYAYEKFDKSVINSSSATDSTKDISTNTNEMSKLTSKLKNLKSILSKEYIGELNEDDMIAGAIKGYVEGIGDEYTEYFTEEEMKSFMEDTTGKYVGIGIYMQEDIEENGILILSAMKGSPAEEAGIKSGDIITMVDGIECSEYTLTEAANKIKGDEGTKVKIEIKRGEEILNFEIERKSIEVPQVASEMLENNIGYITISNFSEDAVDHFEDQFKELQKQGASSLIIDLRNNGGGIVDEALAIGELFSNKGDKLLIKKDVSEKEKVTSAKDDAVINVPVVVLINEYSASAAEILAGILRDNISAKLVGKNTYGKGVIQTAYTLLDGSGIKVTTDEYFTPNHTKINEVGLAPDVEVDITVETLYVERKDDTQLQKAIEILKQK